MVSTVMKPVRACFGTMAATSAVLLATSPTRRLSWIVTRRPAPMRRGSGIGGSTTPGFG